MCFGTSLLRSGGGGSPGFAAETGRPGNAEGHRNRCPFNPDRIFYGEAVGENKDPSMSRSIDYGTLMHRAMRGLIRDVLTDVQSNGLPGQHHFFITFDTMHPDVEIADWLSDRYPTEMTIVMQHWYDRLDVSEDGFAVALNFGDNPEHLYIPFDAIRTFVDPSVEFGLTFKTQEDDGDADDDEAAGPEDDAADDATAHEADIVSLDNWRK